MKLLFEQKGTQHNQAPQELAMDVGNGEDKDGKDCKQAGEDWWSGSFFSLLSFSVPVQEVLCGQINGIASALTGDKNIAWR